MDVQMISMDSRKLRIIEEEKVATEKLRSDLEANQVGVLMDEDTSISTTDTH
jgi:hypothetical protein